MKRSLLRQFIIAVCVVATIAVNALANALPLNGQQTGAISDRFAIYFVPAGYVFAIWGLIYLGLVAFAVYQALPAQRANPRLAAIDTPFIVASLANILWIFLWHYEVFPVTLVAMLALLGALLISYVRLGVGRFKVSAVERWMVHVPFSIYLGWITVATVANASQLLDFLKWGGWGIAPQAWAAIMLGVAVILAALMTLTRRDAAYLLVLAWAFVGIALKHAATTTVAVSAWLATALVVLLVLFLAAKGLRQGRAMS